LEGIIKAGVLIGYILSIRLLKDVRRVFQYHGAEHKTVHAYEAEVPLEIDSVRKYGTAHVRCGTSFIFVVIIISIIVFSLVGLHNMWWMVLSRIILVPVIAGISYEFIYFAGRHRDNILVRTVAAPGLWLQKLTTRQPDDSQLEVGIAALRRVIETEQPELVTWEIEPEEEEEPEEAGEGIEPEPAD
jgi:uncharacterized protein YqhQ